MKKTLKKYSAVAAVLIMAVSVSSCGRKRVLISEDELPKLPEPVRIVTDAPVIYEEPETEDSEVVISSGSKLKQGVWYAYSPTGSSYYFFENDGESGVKISVNNGVSSPFRYEEPDNSDSSTEEASEQNDKYIFHFDREDNYTPVSIEFSDDDHAHVFVGGTKEEFFEYVSSQSFAEFMFYTNEELSAKAREEYSKIEENPVRLKRMQINIAEKPGNEVLFQLVKKVVNKETGAEELQVCESYTVNRITAQGFDSAGNYVDLSK